MRWILLLAALQGCTFSFSGYLPAHLRKVVVPVFENQTVRFGLEEEATQAFLDHVIQDGRLRVVGETEAGMEVRGKITDYKREPFEYDPSGRVIRYKVTIRAEIGFYDRQNDQYYLPPRGYTGWAVYDAETETEEKAIQEAMADLADKALRALFSKGF